MIHAYQLTSFSEKNYLQLLKSHFELNQMQNEASQAPKPR